MRRILFIFCVILFIQGISAKSIIVKEKQTTIYNDNISNSCKRKLQHKNIEIVNQLRYLEVKKNGVVIASFDPVTIDRNSLYIWVELSPNGKMILFTTSDQGAFVCNLRGEILYSLGRDIHATNWWDNRYIVGMIDEDDGEDFIKSDLVMVDLKKGERIPIKIEEKIALYPCANKPYIDYFTLDYKKHTLKLKIKN